jgi:hypothetical protein
MQQGGCYIKEGAKAYGLNGVSLFTFGDGDSYNGTGVWEQAAPVFEMYDMDICQGHGSASNVYHHHFFSPCLAEQAGDNFDAHSPLYGFCFDSFPIYGPYQAKGQLAQSCWQKRDYSPQSPTGCPDGKRSCLLVNEFKISEGTTPASTIGPNFTDTDISSSRNVFTTSNGVYYQDYFYNETCGNQGGVYLNEFNGHNHDNYGFHYHFTIDTNGSPVFPYIMGPKYYGCIQGDVCCNSRDVCSKRSVCGETSGKVLQNQQCVYSQNAPTPVPSARPSLDPTPVPSPLPSFEPSPHPTPKPTPAPQPNPTKRPTPNPTPKPTKIPTTIPSPKPTKSPVPIPTNRPTPAPLTSTLVQMGGTSIMTSGARRKLIDSATYALKVSEAFVFTMLAVLNRDEIRGVEFSVDQFIVEDNTTTIVYSLNVTLETTEYDDTGNLTYTIDHAINYTQSSGEFTNLIKNFVPEADSVVSVEYSEFHINAIDVLTPTLSPTPSPTKSNCDDHDNMNHDIIIAAVVGTVGAFILSFLFAFGYVQYIYPTQRQDYAKYRTKTPAEEFAVTAASNEPAVESYPASSNEYGVSSNDINGDFSNNSNTTKSRGSVGDESKFGIESKEIEIFTI